MSRGAVALVALAALSLAGCVLLPLPPVGPQSGNEEVEKLQPRVSTRADVHAALGSPDRSVTQRYEIFEVSKEKGHVFVYIFPWFANVARAGAQDLRVLAEYGPNDVLQNLKWEGRFQDSDLSGTYHYLSSSTPIAPGSQGSQSALSIEPEPTLTWPVPELQTNLTKSTAVAVAPEAPVVALTYRVATVTFEGNISKLVSIDLRNSQTGSVLARVNKAPAGCPELFSPTRVWAPTVFLSDGRHLASVADDAVICVWDSETRRRVRIFEGHRQPRSFFGLVAGTQLTSLVAARSAQILASADRDNLVRVWDGLSGREILALEPCASGPGCGSWVASSLSRLALSDDGRLLGLLQSGADEDWLRLWDTTTGVEVGTMTTPVKTSPRFASLVNLALSPDQRHVVLHMGDHIEVWSMATAASRAAKSPDTVFELERVLIVRPEYFSLPPSPLPAEAFEVNRTLAFSADSRRLIAGDGMAIVWDTDDWRELWRAYPRSEGFALTADGRRVVSGCCVWDLPERDKSTVPAM